MYYFIVNPISGNGKGMKIWNKTERLLQERNIPYQVFFTNRPKHAITLAKDIAQLEHVTMIVAVGGDGTIHDVANALVDTNITMSCIPAGSGNDFFRGTNGGKKHYEHVINRILSSETRAIDIAQMNDHPCVTVIGIGMDGQVAKKTNESSHKKWLNKLGLGKLTYVLSLIQVLFRYKPSTIQLTIDGQLQTISKVWLVAIANFPFYGGGMVICPIAECDDGWLDICVVNNLTRWQLLKIFPSVYLGKHILHPSVTLFRGKHIEIETETPLVVHGDGEVLGETPVQVTIKEKALQVV